MESMFKMLDTWRHEAEKLETGEIAKEKYDKWRYRYHEFDTTQKWVKISLQELSDTLVKELNK
jgi:hypothetical protein